MGGKFLNFRLVFVCWRGALLDNKFLITSFYHYLTFYSHTIEKAKKLKIVFGERKEFY